MYTLHLYQVGGIFLVSTVYCLFMTWRPVQQVDEEYTFRWLIWLGWISLIVIVSSLEGLVSGLDLLVSFAIAFVPMMIRAAILYSQARTRRAITEAHDAAQQIQKIS
jgi:hypothetical protein